MRYLSVLQADIDSLEEACRKPISFIKMDVERNEFQALLGARKVIERDHPIVVLEGDSSEIMDLMRPMGYRRHSLARGVAKLPNALYVLEGANEEAIVPSDTMIEKTIQEAFKRFPI